MLWPSKANPRGPSIGKVPRTAPSLARSLVKLESFDPPLSFDVQILVPSKRISKGVWPTLNVPSVVPSLARSSVTHSRRSCRQGSPLIRLR